MPYELDLAMVVFRYGKPSLALLVHKKYKEGVPIVSVISTKQIFLFPVGKSPTGGHRVDFITLCSIRSTISSS